MQVYSWIHYYFHDEHISTHNTLHMYNRSTKSNTHDQACTPMHQQSMTHTLSSDFLYIQSLTYLHHNMSILSKQQLLPLSLSTYHTQALFYIQNIYTGSQIASMEVTTSTYICINIPCLSIVLVSEHLSQNILHMLKYNHPSHTYSIATAIICTAHCAIHLYCKVNSNFDHLLHTNITSSMEYNN